jgi:hypothetical protein
MRLWRCLPWMLIVGCAEGASSHPAERPRGQDVRSSERGNEDDGEDLGGVEVVDGGSDSRTPRPSKPADAGQRADAGGARAAAASGSHAMSSEDPLDAGSTMSSDEGSREEGEGKAPKDAGRDSGQDAGQVEAGSDAAPPSAAEPEPANTSSCCSASSAPGCGDAALQQCVCALSPRCCSDAWDESCARLVTEKNCQSGVRACVCGSGEGQWQQAYCCEGGWNATCESVSIHKCGATAACP